MTLWHLLLGLCFAMPIAGALASAKLSKAGFSTYALAVAIGLVLGLCFGWGMWTLGRIVADRIKAQQGSSPEWYAKALYFAAMLWIVFGLFVGSWVSSAATRLIF